MAVLSIYIIHATELCLLNCFEFYLLRERRPVIRSLLAKSKKWLVRGVMYPAIRKR